MTIIKYDNDKNIYVKFLDEYEFIIKTQYKLFKNGNIKNPYDKEVLNVGYIGFGDFKTSNNCKHTKEYETWLSMMHRCYDEKYQKNHPTYKDCILCEEWHCFQNFGKWYRENYYEIDGQQMCLDKDVLRQNKKIYSPETCIFLPKCINSVFTKKAKSYAPTGVYKYEDKFMASCKNFQSSSCYLGIFNTQDEAFQIYKTYKENIFKNIAEEYKDKVPEKVYNAILNFKLSD